MFESLLSKKPKYSLEEIFSRLMLELKTGDEEANNLNAVLKHIVDVFNADSGSIYLYQSQARSFLLNKWVINKPLNTAISEDFEFIPYLKQTGSACFKDSVATETRYYDIRPVGLHYFTELNAACVVPLLLNKKWVGLFHLGRRSEKYGKEEYNLLMLIGSWLAYQVSNIQMFDQINQQNKQMEEVTKLKNELMANVTHELRTPLHGIIGLADVLLEGMSGPITDDQIRHLEMIKNAGRTLLEIVNNILSLTEVRANKDDIEVKKINLARLVHEAADFFQGALRESKNHLASKIETEACIYGDEEQIRTVLINLIGNATKFTKEGQIEIFADRNGEMIKVGVKDTGIGIATENRDKIFDEFQQVNGSKTRTHSGAGLGLAIAKKIIELHGGRIWVDSKEGAGSTFYFTLPTMPANFGRFQDSPVDSQDN